MVSDPSGYLMLATAFSKVQWPHALKGAAKLGQASNGACPLSSCGCLGWLLLKVPSSLERC
jgi:hypothetical protein